MTTYRETLKVPYLKITSPEGETDGECAALARGLTLAKIPVPQSEEDLLFEIVDLAAELVVRGEYLERVHQLLVDTLRQYPEVLSDCSEEVVTVFQLKSLLDTGSPNSRWDWQKTSVAATEETKLALNWIRAQTLSLNQDLLEDYYLQLAGKIYTDLDQKYPGKLKEILAELHKARTP